MSSKYSEDCRTIGHQISNANSREISGEETREAEPGGCAWRTANSWHSGSAKHTNSAANKAWYCPYRWTRSESVIQAVRILNVTILVGIFAGKDPNHEPSKKLPILRLHSHG